MECPHIENNVKLLNLPKLSSFDANFLCSKCSTTKNPWICLSCGVVNCGRYINGHAKGHFELEFTCQSNLEAKVTSQQHFNSTFLSDSDTLIHESSNQQSCNLASISVSLESPPKLDPSNKVCHKNTDSSNSHSICLDLENFSVFCYLCDEFVINDTTSELISKIRTKLKFIQRAQNSIQCKENNHSLSKARRRVVSESNENKKKRIKKDEGTVKPKTSGLRNLGNTCFMNAVLQSLSNIQSFCGYIKQLPSLETKMAKKKRCTRSCPSEEEVFLVEELRKTLIDLWQGEKTAISPEALFSVIWKVVPRFRGYQQQDAHEFMRYLLDRLHTELLALLPFPPPNSDNPFIGPRGKNSIVTAIFGGLLQNEVNCLSCGIESKKHDPFLDLSLDIPTLNGNGKTSNGDSQEIYNLSDCLSQFTEVEELEESEYYNCNNCKKKQRSTKKFWIRRLPNVLCLHIKRFRWNSTFRVKVNTHVEFPLHGLDMSSFVLDSLHETRNSCSGGNEYDLAAVVVHHGSGAGSGHYTSYAFHDGRWYLFNDSSVSPCDEETVASCKAYILFYVRRELKLPKSLSLKS